MEDECVGRLHPRARKGIQLFNEGRYFEAHEELEAAWRAEANPIRHMYQGILEAGVVYLHLQRGNLAGARKVFGRSMRWLIGWPRECRGVQIGELRADLEAAIMEADRLGVTRIADISAAFFKPIHLQNGAPGYPVD